MMFDPISAFQGKHVLVLGDCMYDEYIECSFVKCSRRGR